MADAKRDANFRPTLIGVSSADEATPTLLQVDPLTGRLLVDSSGSLSSGEAHTTGDDGMMMLAVRKDAGGTFVDTDGDYSPLQVDANGYLRVTGKLLPPDVDVTTHTNYVKKYYTNAGAVTDGIVWSPASGKRWHVVTMYLQTSADATVTLEDDLAAGDSPVWKGELKAGSGVVIPWGEKYPLASGEDAADLIITTSAGNIYVTMTGYEI